MQTIARSKNGRCLSRRYVNNQTRLLWECSDGHRWKAVADPIINRNVWCPACAGRPEYTIANMRELAEERGGRCISKRYVNAVTPLLWECSDGHCWSTTANSLRHSNTWCPYCAGVARSTIEKMRELAAGKGGRCLSKEYVNVNTELLWQCAEGHTWKSRAHNIIHSGTWCHTCARYGKLTIEEMQQIAKERGGECLSKRYVNIGTKLRWRCGKGHVWRATPKDLKSRKSWCPYCSASPPITIGRLRKAARKRGGVCLSDAYIVGKKLRWKCNNGHQWEAHANSVLRDSWCPHCYHTYCYSESRCRYMFEQLLRAKFPQDETMLGGLQLDGYSSRLGVAFEYNGRQHYDPHFYFHTGGSFEEIQRRDRKKVELCRERKIKFIVIPYHKVKTNAILLSFIVGQLRKRKIPLARKPEEIDLANIPLNKSRLEEISQAIAPRGLRCVSTEYINASTKLIFECSHGHRWSAEPSRMKSGGGCPHCSGRYRHTIETVRAFAHARGGKCLSATYRNISTMMRWQCERGHRWKSNFSNLYHGRWLCRECRNEDSLEMIRELARKKNGRCLSPRYTSDKKYMRFECAKGHRWKTLTRVVKDGGWCLKCRRESLRLTLGQINRDARKRKFRCLSTTYVNSAEKLLWECHQGHTWYASANQIRTFKSGCPDCWNKRRNKKMR